MFENATIKLFVISMLISAVLQGIYTLLFCQVMSSRRRHGIDKPLVTVALVALYFMCTSIFVLHIVLLYNATLTYRESIGSVDYLKGTSPIYVSSRAYVVLFRNVLLLLSGLVADAMIVWRAYVVWNKNKYVLAVPGSILAATTCSGLGLLICGIAMEAARSTKKWSSLYTIFVVIAWSGTLLTNFVSTILIAGRIWWMSRRSISAHTKTLSKKIMEIITQCGAVYTLTTLALTITYNYSYAANRFITNIIPMVISMTPTVMVLYLNSAASSPTAVSNKRSYIELISASETKLRLHSSRNTK